MIRKVFCSACFLMFWFAGSGINAVHAGNTVVVGISNEINYPIRFEDGSGLSVDLVNALNDLKTDYVFEHRNVSTMRLRHLLFKGLIDVASFSNIQWGWHKNKVSNSIDMLRGGDRYITLKKPGKTTQFFKNTKGVTKLGLRSKQYQLVNFEVDADELRQKYNMTLVDNEVQIINEVLQGGVGMGIVSDAVLGYMRESSPRYFEQLLVSRQYDSEYNQHYLVSNNGVISTESLNSLLLKLKESGRLGQIYAKYGLKTPGF